MAIWNSVPGRTTLIAGLGGLVGSYCDYPWLGTAVTAATWAIGEIAHKVLTHVQQQQLQEAQQQLQEGQQQLASTRSFLSTQLSQQSLPQLQQNLADWAQGNPQIADANLEQAARLLRENMIRHGVAVIPQNLQNQLINIHASLTDILAQPNHPLDQALQNELTDLQNAIAANPALLPVNPPLSRITALQQERKVREIQTLRQNLLAQAAVTVPMQQSADALRQYLGHLDTPMNPMIQTELHNMALVLRQRPQLNCIQSFVNLKAALEQQEKILQLVQHLPTLLHQAQGQNLDQALQRGVKEIIQQFRMSNVILDPQLLEPLRQPLDDLLQIPLLNRQLCDQLILLQNDLPQQVVAVPPAAPIAVPPAAPVVVPVPVPQKWYERRTVQWVGGALGVLGGLAYLYYKPIEAMKVLSPVVAGGLGWKFLDNQAKAHQQRAQSAQPSAQPNAQQAIDFDSHIQSYNAVKKIRLNDKLKTKIEKPQLMNFATAGNQSGDQILSATIQALANVPPLLSALPKQIDNVICSEMNLFGKEGAAALGKKNQNNPQLSPQKKMALLAIAQLYETYEKFDATALRSLKENLRTFMQGGLNDVAGLEEQEKLNLQGLSILLELNAILRVPTTVAAADLDHLYHAIRRVATELPDQMDGGCSPAALAQVIVDSINGAKGSITAHQQKPKTAETKVILDFTSKNEATAKKDDFDCVSVVCWEEGMKAASTRLRRDKGSFFKSYQWYDWTQNQTTLVGSEPLKFPNGTPAYIAFYTK